MRIKESKSRVLFRVINVTILLSLALLCLLPFINAIAISLSQNQYVSAGRVLFWPKGFTTVSYRYLINRVSFWSSFRISIIRCVLGTAITLILVLLTAYPLSKDSSRLTGRNNEAPKNQVLHCHMLFYFACALAITVYTYANPCRWIFRAGASSRTRRSHALLWVRRPPRCRRHSRKFPEADPP